MEIDVEHMWANVPEENVRKGDAIGGGKATEKGNKIKVAKKIIKRIKQQIP